MEQLTPEQVQVLVPLLQAFPSYAPYALVFAHLTNMLVEEVQRQVEVAWGQGVKAWTAFIHPLRTVLTGLRLKLHPCHLDIVAVQHTGYLLRPWRNAAEENSSVV